ncbi:MAG: hypothetical protein JOZ15_20900, partial [Acidobacteria bacterium]|nr:hypothetical protein [Acidobacteriota bacterium]
GSVLLGLAAAACSPGGPPAAASGGPPGAAAGGAFGAAAGGASGLPAGMLSPAAAGRSVLLPAAETALIEWRRPATVSGGDAAAPPAALPGRPAEPGSTAPRERVSIGLGGLWIGPENPADGPRVHYLFARRRRSGDLAELARSFAPFQLFAAGEGGEQAGDDGSVRAPVGAPQMESTEAPSQGADTSYGSQAGSAEASSRGADTSYGSIVFNGRGAAQASPAERRMIAEWTRAATIEAAGEGGGQSPYGLAFTWHRGAVAGGVCDDLAVYLSGEVSAGSCGAGAELGGRLAGERLQRLYGWVDGLAAFQDAGEQGVRADALLERLVFAGRGRRPASREDVAAIEAFAGALHRELTAPGAAAAEAAVPGVTQRRPAPATGPGHPDAPPAEPAPTAGERAAGSSPRPALRVQRAATVPAKPKAKPKAKPTGADENGTLPTTPPPHRTAGGPPREPSTQAATWRATRGSRAR